MKKDLKNKTTATIITAAIFFMISGCIFSDTPGEVAPIPDNYTAAPSTDDPDTVSPDEENPDTDADERNPEANPNGEDNSEEIKYDAFAINQIFGKLYQSPYHADIESLDEDGNYVLHIYEVVDNGDESHTATVDWYTIDPYTGDIETFFGEQMNIEDFINSSTDDIDSLIENPADFDDIIKIHRYYIENMPDSLADVKYDSIISRGIPEMGIYNYDNPFDYIGYSIEDITGDGKEELIIATNEKDCQWNGSRVLAIFEMTDNGPERVIEGVFRGRYAILNDNRLYFEGSSGAGNSGWSVGKLAEDGRGLLPDKCVYTDTWDENDPKVYVNTTGEWTYNEDELVDISVSEAYAESDEHIRNIKYLDLKSFE